MGKKKSLGHNPLAYSTLGHASFDFIASTEEESQNETETKTLDDKVNKVVASYYLEEPVVNKIKEIADRQHMSYSSVVSKILKHSLNKIS